LAKKNELKVLGEVGPSRPFSKKNGVEARQMVKKKSGKGDGGNERIEKGERLGSPAVGGKG